MKKENLGVGFRIITRIRWSWKVFYKLINCFTGIVHYFMNRFTWTESIYRRKALFWFNWQNYRWEYVVISLPHSIDIPKLSRNGISFGENSFYHAVVYNDGMIMMFMSFLSLWIDADDLASRMMEYSKYIESYWVILIIIAIFIGVILFITGVVFLWRCF